VTTATVHRIQWRSGGCPAPQRRVAFFRSCIPECRNSRANPVRILNGLTIRVQISSIKSCVVSINHSTGCLLGDRVFDQNPRQNGKQPIPRKGPYPVSPPISLRPYIGKRLSSNSRTLLGRLCRRWASPPGDGLTENFNESQRVAPTAPCSAFQVRWDVCALSRNARRTPNSTQRLRRPSRSPARHSPVRHSRRLRTFPASSSESRSQYRKENKARPR
jgi:hypothetical protein